MNEFRLTLRAIDGHHLDVFEDEPFTETTTVMFTLAKYIEATLRRDTTSTLSLKFALRVVRRWFAEEQVNRTTKPAAKPALSVKTESLLKTS